MKTAYRNTLDYKEDVAQKLMKSLHEISKLLCVQECKRKITNMKHQAVSDFPRENHVQVFAFLDVDINAEKELELKKLYRSENAIAPSPPPLSINQTPPPPITTAAAPQAPQPPPQQVAPATAPQQQSQAAPGDLAMDICKGGGGGPGDVC